MHFLVTGANRGLGLEFTKQLLEAGHQVIATSRNPSEASDLRALESASLRLMALDISKPESVDAFAKALNDEAIDVLINNAGHYSRVSVGFDHLNFDGVLHDFAVNGIGTLRVTQALLPNLRRGNAKKIANISSKMGSITDNTSGGSYAYRMSKAAVNMATRSLANDLRSEGFTVLTFHPGWVQTDMGGPNALIEPPESIAGMLKVVDNAGLEQSGRFWDYRGQELPW
ncbi:SDR family oxidoreductase [Microvenator marinus]|uniref:SDR family oxidoreductase n=1 Tax=Microvenator marinus TaxID=2600177 RepID=A0A5B8XTE2_9DELT|nr:SDR family oxidoreductase [Microvenator marinus]QED26916.1 SDR family oxidoreductase [Microvenator marinus]